MAWLSRTNYKLNTDKMTEIHEWSSKKSLLWNTHGVKPGGKGAPHFPKQDFTWYDDLTAHTHSTADSRLLIHLENAPQALPAPRPHESCLRILKFKTCKKIAPFWYHKGPKMSLGLGFSFHHCVCGWGPLPRASLQCLENHVPSQQWGAPGSLPGNILDM